MQILMLKKKLSGRNGKVINFIMNFTVTSPVSFSISSAGKKIPS